VFDETACSSLLQAGVVAQATASGTSTDQYDCRRAMAGNIAKNPGLLRRQIPSARDGTCEKPLAEPAPVFASALTDPHA
jgi:hypothetical protein